MRQIVKSYKITDFGYGLLRMFQQFTRRVQTILSNELRESHPLAPLEIGTERRTVHAYLRCNVVQRNGMDIMLHHVCAYLLHTPNVLLDTHRLSCERAVGRSKDDWQQTKHRTQAPQFVHTVYFR